MANRNSTKVVTGIVRLSYANVWEPTSVNGGTPKYGVSLIIPKSDKKTITAINKAIDAAIQAGIGKFGGKIPNKAALKLPLRDGDAERDDEAYANSYFVNANSTTAPQTLTAPFSPSSTDLRCIPAATRRFLSTSTPSIPTATAVSPAVWATSRRSGTANPSAADHRQRMTSPQTLTMTMISSHDFG